MTKVELANHLQSQVQMVSDQIRQHWSESDTYEDTVITLQDLLAELTGQLITVNKGLIESAL